MDRHDTGLAARDYRDLRPKSTWVDRVGERRTTHHISIPSGIVLELSQAAEDLRSIAGYVGANYSGAHAELRTIAVSGAHAERLRTIAVTLQTVAEQANT